MGMRQRIAAKLRDSGGATILMALFAMLVASVVCIVILGASVTAVKQSVADHEQEQNTLALQSAGELVRSEILNTGTIEFKVTSTEGGAVSYSPSDVTETSLSGELVRVAEESLENQNGVGEGSFDIDASSTSDKLAEPYVQPRVHGDIVLKRSDSTCQLIVTLSVGGRMADPSNLSSNSAGPQYLFLNVSGQCSGLEGVEGSGAKLTFKWSKASFALTEEASANG